MHLRNHLYSLTIWILVVVSSSFAFAADTQKPSVLLLNSYHTGYSWTDTLTDAVRKKLQAFPGGVTLHVEYMDTKRRNDPEYLQSLAHLYALRYAGETLSLLISADDNALRFLKEKRRQLFPDVPVVFCGVNDRSPEVLHHLDNVTGIYEATSPASTLSVALDLHPETKQIIVIGDTTFTGKNLIRRVKAAAFGISPAITFSYVDDVSKAELLQRLHQLPENALVLLTVFIRDAQGKVYSLEESTEFITKASPVPVYGLHSFALEHGVVGGMLTSGRKQGEKAAELGLRILQGEKATDIPIISSGMNRFVFDAVLLRQFNANVDNLPSSSVLIRNKSIFSEKYLREIVIITLVCLVLFTIIIALLVGRKKLVIAEKQLREFSVDLEKRVHTRTHELQTAKEQLEAELTERHRAEEAQSITEQTLRTVLNSVHDAILIHERDGTVRDANDQMLSLFGISRAALPSLSIKRDLSDEGNPVRELDNLWEQVMDGMPAFFEWRARRVNNQALFDVEVALTRIEVAGRGMILASIRDISRRKERERRLRLLARAMEQAGEAIVIIDTQMHISFVNPELSRLAGVPADVLIGTRRRIFYQADQESLFPDNILRVLGTGEAWSGVVDISSQAGEITPVEGTIGPVRDSSGSIISYVGVFRDISDKLQLETQLRQAQKLESIGQLAAGVAHEINTPLQYVGDNIHFLTEAFHDTLDLVNVYTEVVKTNSISDEKSAALQAAQEEADMVFLQEEVPKALENAVQGVSTISEIVLAMKTFSHPGTEDAVQVDINEALTSTITVSRSHWKDVAEIRTEFAEELPVIRGLGGELNQAFLNVVVNAADAIAEHNGEGKKGVITLKSLRDGNMVRVEITDTGGGIPDEVRQRIFDPFFTTKDVGKGTGQGLAIAYNVIVEKHHGMLDFVTHEGEGTTFIFSLPIEYSVEV